MLASGHADHVFTHVISYDDFAIHDTSDRQAVRIQELTVGR